jgi:hypothetical protein
MPISLPTTQGVPLQTSRAILGLTAIALGLTPAGVLGQTKEHAPVSLRSSQKMGQDKPKSESWTYISPTFRSSRFPSVCVMQTKVYSGPDAQFPGTSAADKQRFAGILTDRVREELGKSFTVYPDKRPGCLAMQMTLVGLQDTKGGVATATRVTPFGFAFSAVNSIRGKGGTFTGSMLVALEVTGGKKNELLVAAVRRREPDALDIPATFSMTDTVNAIARDYGRDLSERLAASGVIGAR